MSKRTKRGQKENTGRETFSFKGNRFYPEIEEDQTKASLTFLSHVVHAVGHSGALLFDAESRETSIIVDKVVVCRRETRRFNSRLKPKILSSLSRVLLVNLHQCLIRFFLLALILLIQNSHSKSKHI